MFGKINLALIRREAETYRAHGLPEEAGDLYKNFLSSSPNLPPEIKAGIECQLNQIDLERGCDALQESQAISDEQVAVIRQGWEDHSTFDEILACAKILYQIGRFSDALVELKRLSRDFDELKRATGEIAACLIQLHGYEELPAAVDQLASEFFNGSKDIHSFQVALAEKMLKWGRHKHARFLLRQIMRHKDLPDEIQKQILALSRIIDVPYSFSEIWSPAPQGGRPSSTGTTGRSNLGRIWDTLKLFKLRLLSRNRNAQLFIPDIPEDTKRDDLNSRQTHR